MTSTTATSEATLRRNNLTGILFMMAGSASFICNDAIVKLVGAQLPPGEIITLRGLFATSLLLAASLWFGALHWPAGELFRRPFYMMLIGQLGSTITFVTSLMHMKLSDANGIQQVQPLAVTAASALFLAEPVGWRRWLAALVGLIGVLLIIKPGTSAFEPFALVSASCVLFVVFRDLGTRSVAAGVPSLLLALASSAVVTLAGLAMRAGETWVMPASSTLLAIACGAVLLVSGYLCVTSAVRIGQLSVVSPFRYASTLYAVLLQVFVWGQLPDSWSLIGMTVVIGAGLYTFHREQTRGRVRLPS
jgi:drug/metabolite transporter (DMT)-like permease